MMTPASAGCIADSTDEKGQVAHHSAQPHSINTDAKTNNERSVGTQRNKRTLYPRPVGAAAEWLMMTPLLFSDGDLVKAQRFYESIRAAREEWLRVMNRRLPRPEALDRERYAPRRRETAR